MNEQERLRMEEIRRLDEEVLEVEEANSEEDSEGDEHNDTGQASRAPQQGVPGDMTYDTRLPSLHTYLGEVDDIPGGRSFVDGGSTFVVPLYYMEGVVLFPGDTLPLRVMQPSFLAAVKRAMRQREGLCRTVGVVQVVAPDGYGQLAKVGTTAEIRQLRELDDGTLNLVTKGRQRFQLGRTFLGPDNAPMGEIKILPGDNPPQVPRAAFGTLAAFPQTLSGKVPAERDKVRAEAGITPALAKEATPSSRREAQRTQEASSGSSEDRLRDQSDQQELSRDISELTTVRRLTFETSQATPSTRADPGPSDRVPDLEPATPGRDDYSSDEDSESDTPAAPPDHSLITILQEIVEGRRRVVPALGQRAEQVAQAFAESAGDPEQQRQGLRRLADRQAVMSLLRAALGGQTRRTRQPMRQESDEEEASGSSRGGQEEIWGVVSKAWASDKAQWRRRAQLSAWPHWVYAMYDAYGLARRAADMMRHLAPATYLTELVHDPESLSYYVASNLPVQDATKQELLEMNGTVYRLRRELQLLEGMDALRCCHCNIEVARQRDLMVMSADGAIGTYVNPNGYVHETLTLKRVRGLELEGGPETENSWFPGYAWTIAHCGNCGMHMGWRFTAAQPGLSPAAFWGLRRSQLTDQTDLSSEK